MRSNKLLSCLWSAIVAFLLALGAAGSIGSGFGMNMGGAMPVLVGAAALFFAVCFGLFGGAGLAFGVFALVCGYLWRTGDLVLQMKGFLYRISFCYHEAYGWGVLSWRDGDLNGVANTIPLALIGCLVALAVTWTICRQRRAWLAVSVSILPMTACVVVTDTVPDMQYLFQYLLGMILLVMGQTVRRKNAAEGNRLLMMLVLPAALAVGLLFWVLPEETYVPPDDAGEEMIMGWIDSFRKSDVEGNVANWFTDIFSVASPETVDLKNSGPRTEYRYKVMEVVAAQTGPLYLRGKAYDTYDGVSWSASAGTWEEDFSYLSACADYGAPYRTVGTVQITTRSAHDVLYFPYDPGEIPFSNIEQGSIANKDKVLQYTFEQLEYAQPEEEMVLYTMMSSYWQPATDLKFEMAQYLQLPNDTRQRAEAYLEAYMGYLPQDLTDWLEYLNICEEIRELVSSSAVYDLKTSRMPDSETDFAMWFLEESDTGYCVHFATAATVLLRAAGVPARYVTGYLVDGVMGTEVTARGSDAHAWVEYWHPSLGWLKLEATPGDGTAAGDNDGDTSMDAPNDTQPSERVPETIQTDAQNPGEQQGTPTESTVSVFAPKDESGWDLSWLWRMLTWLLIWAGIAGLMVGQWRLRLVWKRKRMKMGSTNMQALIRWQELSWRLTLLRDMPSEDMRALAEKAKFSQYETTAEELGRLDRELELAETRMRRRPLFYQLVYRLVFAVY